MKYYIEYNKDFSEKEYWVSQGQPYTSLIKVDKKSRTWYYDFKFGVWHEIINAEYENSIFTHITRPKVMKLILISKLKR